MNRWLTGLWRHPDFMKLWIGQSISELGTRISRDGIPLIAVITLAATPAQMGLLTAFASIPVLALSLFAGVWVDRLPRRPIMVAMDIGRLLLLLTIPVAALTGTLRIELLYVIVALIAIMSLVFDAAYRAILPALVARDQIVEGNSKLSTTEALAEIGGPSITGLLVQWISAPLAVVFDAVSYLFSSISFALIRTPEPPREPRPADTPTGSSVLTEIREGLAVIAADPRLRALIIGMALRSFIGNFYAALYDIYLIRDIGLTPALLGVVVSAGGVGALIGALTADRIQRRFGVGRTITGSLIVSAAAGILTPLSLWLGALAPVALIAAQIIGDGAMLIFFINETSLRQIIVPDRLLGRTNATFAFLAQGISPVGALVAGGLATVFGAQVTLWIAVSGILVTALWVARSALRRIETVGEVIGS